MKATGLYNRLCSEKLLWKAWLQVKDNDAAGGIDNVTVKQFVAVAHDEILKVLDLLKQCKWLPQPYKKVDIPKPNAELRTLGLLCVSDKIVQQAMYMLLYPLIDKKLSAVCYAYRSSKGAVKAIRYVQHLNTFGKYGFMISCDIRKYFDNIDHALLMQMVGEIIDDDRMLNLIRLCIKMGRVKSGNRWEDITSGVPQGSVISPLLANLFLTVLDNAVLSKNCGYARYADDFVLFAKTSVQAAEISTLVKEKITSLKLALKQEPLIVSAETGFTFLGISFRNDNILINADKVTRLKEKISLACNNEKDFRRKILKKTITGIRAFYGQLFAESELVFLDEFLLQTMLAKFRKSPQCPRTRKEIISMVADIQFITSQYEHQKLKLFLPLLDEIPQKAKKEKAQNKTIVPEKLVEKRKKLYQKLESQGMELVVNTFGTFIGKSQNHIYVKTKDKNPERIPLVNIRHISVLTSGVSISSDLIYHCAENNIPVTFFSRAGQQYASLYHPFTTEMGLWLAQLQTADTPKALNVAVAIVDAKIRNQVNLLKYFHKYHKSADAGFADLFKEKIVAIEKIRKELARVKKYALDDYRQQLLPVEGRAAAVYWELVANLIDDDSDFSSREHRGAKDLVNAMLNYGYSILYSRIWHALLRSKLNPYISYLHVPDSGKPTLSFDVIEMFRQQAVDRVVISLLQKNEKMEIKDGFLTDESRAKLTQNISERLYRYELYRGKQTRFADIIDAQASHFAKYIAGETKTYKPYIAKW